MDRWFQDPSLDTSRIAPVSPYEHQKQVTVPLSTVNRNPPQSLIGSRPLNRPSTTGARAVASDIGEEPDTHAHSQIMSLTQTIPTREVYQEARSALNPLLNAIQTQEQLHELLNDLKELQ